MGEKEGDHSLFDRLGLAQLRAPRPQASKGPQLHSGRSYTPLMHPPSPLCAPGKRIRGATTVPRSETHTFAFVPSSGTSVHVYHSLQWTITASVNWNARRLGLSAANEALLVVLILTRAVPFLCLRQSSERASNSVKENTPPGAFPFVLQSSRASRRLTSCSSPHRRLARAHRQAK